MIIIFHQISLLVIRYLRHRNVSKSDKNKKVLPVNNEQEDSEYSLRFRPPVYKQRYGEVFKTLIDSRWRTKINTLCDFGCAEFGIFTFLKQLNRLNNIIFVDIDEDTLLFYKSKVYPLTIEYLSRREEALNVSIFKGSVGDPDYHLLNVDVVTAIELIEHLYPDTLDAFAYNIFSYIQPKIVMVTTPNADFNVLFGWEDENKTFRHYDHKFEWTRQQFQDWSNNIILRFPDYTMYFTDIGEGPAGTEALGACSQMATFVRKDLCNESYILQKYTKLCICDNESMCQKNTGTGSVMSCKCTCSLCSPSFSWGICTYYSFSIPATDSDSFKDPSYNVYYKLLDQIEYPVDQDSRTEEEKILDEFRYRINILGHMNGRFFVEERDRSEIPIIELLYGPEGTNITEIELCTLLKSDGYEVQDCIVQEIGESEKCVIYTPILMDNCSTSSESLEPEGDFHTYILPPGSDSDWDESIKEETNNKDVKAKLGETSGLKEENHSDVLTNNVVPEESHQQLQAEESQNNCEYQEETDIFDDAISSPIPSDEDNKLHLKRALDFETHSFSSVPNNVDDEKLDNFTINELDRFRDLTSTKNAIGRVLKLHQRIRKMFFKEMDPVAGPSALPPLKKRKMKIPISDSKYEPTLMDDMKSLTNCIIKNTLNVLNVDDDRSVVFANVPMHGPVFTGTPGLIPEIDETQMQYLDVDGITDSLIDVRGNSNINGIRPSKFIIENNIINFNLQLPPKPSTTSSQPIPPLASSEMSIPEFADIQEQNIHSEDNAIDQNDSDISYQCGCDEYYEDAVSEGSMTASVDQSSTEAVADPNSTIDLTVFDTDVTIPEENAPHPENSMGANYLSFDDLIVVVPILLDPLETLDLGQNTNGFPAWLLEILNTQVREENLPPTNDLEEPHFYCQGDGLGVHSSLLSVEVDEGEEASSESSDESGDYAEVDPGISTMDMSSLPEDSQGLTTDNQDSLEEETDNRIAANSLPAIPQNEVEAMDSVSTNSNIETE
ncbi:uncharacterized protein LOC114339827 isoform X2 [Diabrotica virgifera virgifera]|uniref:Small RNA 2'-O-methyltransferase n=2 Tax=Diabrotica virgifera virgifera TaxID=50390 RepID=A0ABM5KA28_DIAVI|nr:uncharacterized protein LOC114339827 isoform X2 [Diabrotica virgifera virgifera]